MGSIAKARVHFRYRRRKRWHRDGEASGSRRSKWRPWRPQRPVKPLVDNPWSGIPSGRWQNHLSWSDMTCQLSSSWGDNENGNESVGWELPYNLSSYSSIHPSIYPFIYPSIHSSKTQYGTGLMDYDLVIPPSTPTKPTNDPFKPTRNLWCFHRPDHPVELVF